MALLAVLITEGPRRAHSLRKTNSSAATAARFDAVVMCAWYTGSAHAKFDDSRRKYYVVKAGTYE